MNNNLNDMNNDIQSMGETNIDNASVNSNPSTIVSSNANTPLMSSVSQETNLDYNSNNNSLNVNPNLQTNSEVNASLSSPSVNHPKKDNKKLLIIGAVILLLGIVIFILFKVLGSDKTTADLNAIFDPNKPIIIQDKDKYGYITAQGKIMIKPQYKSASDFYGDYAVVLADDSTVFYQVIDKEGNVKITQDGISKPKYYQDYNLWVINDNLYDAKLKSILDESIKVDYISDEYFEYSDSKNKEAGVINHKGKKVFSTPGSFVSVEISENEYNSDDLYADVRIYGDTDKEVIVSLKSGDILFTSEDTKKYYLSEEENGIFYYYNKEDEDGYNNKQYLFFIDNKLAYQTTEMVDEVEVYDYDAQILAIDYGYDYEELGKSQRRYYYDVKNKKMLDKSPEKTNSLSDLEYVHLEKLYGFKKYSSSGKYGLMAGDDVIVPCEYEGIDFLEYNLYNYLKAKGQELVILKNDKELILYNLKKSAAVTSFPYGYLNDYEDSTFIKISTYEKGDYSPKEYIVYNLLSGKSMTLATDKDLDIGSNYITIKKDGKIIYYNTDFKQIYEVKAN